jgi:hypothetical protein
MRKMTGRPHGPSCDSFVSRQERAGRVPGWDWEDRAAGSSLRRRAALENGDHIHPCRKYQQPLTSWKTTPGASPARRWLAGWREKRSRGIGLKVDVNVLLALQNGRCVATTSRWWAGTGGAGRERDRRGWAQTPRGFERAGATGHVRGAARRATASSPRPPSHPPPH